MMRSTLQCRNVADKISYINFSRLFSGAPGTNASNSNVNGGPPSTNNSQNNSGPFPPNSSSGAPTSDQPLNDQMPVW